MSDNEITPETQIAKHKGPSTRDEIAERRELIIQIREEIRMQGKVPDNFMVAEELRKRGHQVDLRTVYRDMLEINKDNHFVLDFAMHNYNQTLEYMIENMEQIIRGCDDIIAKTWTNSKVVTTEEKGANGEIVKKQKIVAEPLAGPRIQAYNLKKDMMKLYAEIFKGGIIDAGLAIAQEEANNFKHEFEKMRQENHQQKELLDKFKESTTTVDTTKDSNQA